MPAYVGAQLGGGLVGAALIVAAFGGDAVDLGTGQTSIGGSLNPARTFGPLVIGTIGGGDTFWGDLPAYVIGPLLGGAVAAFAYDAVARPLTFELEAAQGTAGDIEGRRDKPVEPPPVTTRGPGGERPSRSP